MDRLEQLQEEMMKENKESTAKLTEMMESLLKKTDDTSKETKKDHNQVIGMIGDLDNILTTLEKGGATKGESAVIEQHKSSIEKARYSIKMLNMKGKVTEENVKKTPGNTTEPDTNHTG